MTHSFDSFGLVALVDRDFMEGGSRQDLVAIVNYESRADASLTRNEKDVANTQHPCQTMHVM